MSARFELATLDCLDWLRSIDDESVDLVITDPAYSSLEKHRAIGTTTRLTADWFPVVSNEELGDVMRELYRALKPDTHCYVFCDQETMHWLHWFVFTKQVPFAWWKFLVWEKTRAPKPMRARAAPIEDPEEARPSAGMGYHYRAAHECIVFLEKGKRRLNDLGVCDVLQAPRVRGGYPTEKPVDVIKTLVRQSSSKGEIVIDPFLGSGSTGDAALQLGRHFAGCDITQRAVDIATQRLSSHEHGVVLVPRRPPAQGTLFG